jgi:hypothetical protein
MIEKTSPKDTHLSEKNNWKGIGTYQRLVKWLSIKSLNAQVRGVLRPEHDMIDITRFSKVTVQTECGVYDASECRKAHTGDEKCDHPSTALYSSGGRFEGHVCDIKGHLKKRKYQSQ